MSDSIQNRSIQRFVGVHTFASLLAAQGHMGWVPESVKHKCEKIGLWNHMVNMAEDKITKQVFLWTKSHIPQWTIELHSIMKDARLQYIYVYIQE